ncbi:MAG: ROK family protein, partial [Chloroflexi bacterium]
GPLDLDPGSTTFGSITRTPKAGWAYTDVVGPVRHAFPALPIGFDTDVNGAALAEQRWGAAKSWDTFVYLTVGTGIGGGAMAGGRLVHGLIHPEMGHVPLAKHPDDSLERGVCPFHPHCLESLASGPAILARWGVPGEQLPPDHPAWALESDYLAQSLVSMLCVLSPQGFVLGGSVMHQPQLFPMVRQQVKDRLNGYLVHPRLDTLENMVVSPGLWENAVVLVAVALAMTAYERG